MGSDMTEPLNKMSLGSVSGVGISSIITELKLMQAGMLPVKAMNNRERQNTEPVTPQSDPNDAAFGTHIREAVDLLRRK